jgi:hypothetical protein
MVTNESNAMSELIKYMGHRRGRLRRKGMVKHIAI